MKAKNPKPRKPSAKQKGFVADYVKTKNATEAASRNYDCKDRNVARAVGSENLTKLVVQQMIQGAMKGAQQSIVDLSQNAKNENVRLGASKDILDRGGLKPIDEVNVGMSEESAEALARLKEALTFPRGKK